MNPGARIFLSYARPDQAAVAGLYEKLKSAGYQPWMDVKDILGGEQWAPAIQRAIRGAHFVLACVSSHWIDRRGFLQREIRTILDNWQEKMEHDIYLIPVRLEDCQMLESLQAFQWVDWFASDGWDRLKRSLETGLKRQSGGIETGAPAAPVPMPANLEGAPGVLPAEAGERASVGAAPSLQVLVPEDERPGKHRGLIVLVGPGRPREDPMRQSAGEAIAYHLPDGRTPGLEVCWLVASREAIGSLPVAEDLKAICAAHQVTAYIRVVDAWCLQTTYDLVQRIYKEEAPRAGLSPGEVIGDFTGGTKLMSAGVILACGDRRPMQYMTGRKEGIASMPMRVDFRPRGG